jgi:hypothetical protein
MNKYAVRLNGITREEFLCALGREKLTGRNPRYVITEMESKL